MQSESKRRKVEQALREREERYRTILENIREGYYEVDLTGNYTFFNSSMSKILGYTEEEMMGMNYRLYTDKENAKKVLRDFNEVYRTGISSKVDYEQIKKDGSKMFVETSVALMRDSSGQPTGFRGIVRDITERKRAEEELRDSEALYRNLFKNHSAVKITIDPATGNIVDVNEAAVNYYGWSDERLKQMKIQDINTLSPEEVKEEMEKARAKKRTHFEFRHRRADGSIRDVAVFSSKIVAKGKDLLHSIIHDITEHKRSEEELRESDERYRHMIENSSDLIQSVDPEGRFIFVNPAWREALQYTEEELSGLSLFQMIHPDSMAHCQGVFQNLMLGQSVKGFQATFVSKDGSPIIVEGNVVPRMVDGQVIATHGFFRDITERKRAEDEIQRNYDTQAALNVLLHLSLENISLEEILKRALDLVLSIPRLALEVQGGIFLVEDEPDVLVMKVQSNLAEPIQRMCARVPFGKCFCGRAASMRKIQFSDHLDERHEISYEGIHPHGHYCVPILFAGRTMGVINLYIKEGHHQDQKEEEFLTAIADSLAGIIRRKKAEEELQQTLESLRKAFGATVQVMVSAVESRDPYTAGHQLRVADLARAIATEMRLPQEKIDGIRMAGSIHDIGKLSIPAEILSRPTKLTNTEFSLIKEHPQKGYEILKDVESPWPLAQIVYQHHERMDGSGYPRGLKGEEILLEARIMAVADVVESMASHRPYRPSLGIDVALAEIGKNRGTFYDEAVADTCLRLFQEKGFQLKRT